MNCPWHPNKRVVASCKDCGAGFCIECVRETDQTTLCPNCYRRKLNDIAREFMEPDERKEDRPTVPISGEPKESPPAEEAEPPAAPPAAKVAGGKRGFKEGETIPPEPSADSREDFLSQGPDEDFSQLSEGKPKKGRWFSGVRPGAPPPADAADSPPAVDEAPGAAGDTRRAEAAVVYEDELLKDVMSTLLKPETGAAEGSGPPAREEREDLPAPRALPARARARKDRGGRRSSAAGSERRKSDRAARWAFLAQSRSSEYTLIATSWWKAAIFIALMLLLGAALWALPNAYLIPRDQEYGIHAVAIGLILGLAFWWKAGKKHSTKLAVQASLTTFFALFAGEFLHWFLIVMKHKAFRTIFLDFVSFRFLWENGADILRYTMEAMFPIAFLWILLLPTITAFIIGFGMPPIPEVFLQLWHALKGQVPEEEEASHGLEG